MKENILYSIPPKTKNKINPLETCRNAAIPTTIPQQLAIQHIAAIPQHSIPKYNYRFTAHHHPFPPISSSTGHHAIFPHTIPNQPQTLFPNSNWFNQIHQQHTPQKPNPFKHVDPINITNNPFAPPGGQRSNQKKKKARKLGHQDV